MTGSRRLSRRIGDPWLLGVALVVSILGIAMIYSAGLVETRSPVVGAWRRQAAWLVVALVAFGVTIRIPLRWVEWAAPWAYGVSLALLVVVLIVGVGPGTRSWLDLGVMRVQPAEIAKLGTILMLARVLTGRKEEATRLTDLWKPVLVVLVPLALVIVQPDLGGAVIFGVILVAALYWAGVPLATLFMLLSPGVSLLLGFSAIVWGVWFLLIAAFLYVHRPFVGEAVGVLGANVAGGALTLPIWGQLAPYQQNRILVFLNPEVDPRGAGWHLMQSKVAVGSGGWFGHGFGEGPQKRLAFLPEQHTDFIFSVVGEELGFMGVVFFLGLLGVFLAKVLRIAGSAAQDFGSMVAFCLLAVWTAHLVVNVGMAVGLMPITGLPLPFLSYGGSFLVTLFCGLGIINRVALED